MNHPPADPMLPERMNVAGSVNPTGSSGMDEVVSPRPTILIEAMRDIGYVSLRKEGFPSVEQYSAMYWPKPPYPTGTPLSPF
jgi:hypothetical protein